MALVQEAGERRIKMGFFSKLRTLGSAAGTREAMRKSYYRHRAKFETAPDKVPPDTSHHEAAMYGALATRYRASGSSAEDVEEMEVFIWCELVPFLELETDEAVEALAEYVVWKETPVEARVSWLRSRVQKGAAVTGGSHLLAQQEASGLRVFAGQQSTTIVPAGTGSFHHGARFP